MSGGSTKPEEEKIQYLVTKSVIQLVAVKVGREGVGQTILYEGSLRNKCMVRQVNPPV